MFKSPLGPVYTNTFSFESAYFSIRLGLPSTLTRWSFSTIPYTFKTALDSGSKRKRIVPTVKSVSKWKQWRHYTTWVFFEHAYIIKMTSRHVISIFERFSADGWIRNDNDSVDANQSIRFRWSKNECIWKCINVDGPLVNLPLISFIH